MKSVLRNIAWGASWGFFCGVVYLAFAAVVIGLKGGFSEAPQGVTPVALLRLYPIGGVAAGFIVGLFRPLLGTRSGSVVVGIIAASPVVVGFVVLQEGPINAWVLREWIGAFASAVVLGILGGYMLWGQLHEPAGPSGDPDARPKEGSRYRAARGRRDE